MRSDDDALPGTVARQRHLAQVASAPAAVDASSFPRPMLSPFSSYTPPVGTAERADSAPPAPLPEEPRECCEIRLQIPAW